MTYRVLYGDALAMSGRDLHGRDGVRHERYGTEHEALNRARELLDEDERTVVAIHDAAGNQVSGVCLQLRVGYCRE